MFSKAGNRQPDLRSSAVACSLRLLADTRKHSSEMCFMPLTIAPRPIPGFNSELHKMRQEKLHRRGVDTWKDVGVVCLRWAQRDPAVNIVVERRARSEQNLRTQHHEADTRAKDLIGLW
jgi:hypothetical protein